MIGLLSLWGAISVQAQVTYNVFPAKAGNQPPAMAQPTGVATAGHVTLIVQDSTIGYVIRTLAHQGHLRALYNASNPIFAKPITVRVVDIGVMDAFVTVLKGTGLVAAVGPDGETVIVRPRLESIAAGHQRIIGGTVIGRVTDSASGQGLGGASVKVEGTKLSTVTSDSGHFTLKDVPIGDQVLSVKLFG
ncbi:MAG TPA: carboxypeptidase-like regulatory domain-containing protein, partial [Gemmatimonadaceae bacterium]|nr:carboxypeptidase-like regulatory domain-containing protein [Gemmatimonadaceae bacterium]